MADSTELVVIGAGPGGYAAAFYAADKGMDVTLIEAGHLGGTCLNVGCIPSKALLHMASLIDETRHMSDLGLTFGEPKIDLEKIRAFKNKVIDQLRGGIQSLAKSRKVKIIHGFARFASENQLHIETSKELVMLQFQHAIIATGSTPVIPSALKLNSERVVDSTGALELQDIPERFLIVGGGIIGLELGSVYAALGSKVTVIEALDHLAGDADRDLVRLLERKLKSSFESIHLKTQVTSLKDNGDKILVEYQQGEKTENDSFDRVLLCIGRKPTSANLELEKAGISTDERGFIQVEKHVQTANPHVFAIGDVVPGPMLAHKASREARIAVDKIMGLKTEFDNVGIPSVIYTDPEIAWVGLTETEAKAKGIEYKLGKFPWAASGRALAINRTDGLTKILFDPKTERVLGVGIAGVGAGELIAEGGLALEMGAVLEDITNTVHAHPTLSETFMEGAETVHGLATHLFSKKKK